MSATTSSTPAAEAPGSWHLLTAAETTDRLTVSAAVGLDEEQVHRRRELAGPNTLPAPNRRSRVLLLLDQLRNPLVLLLLAAAGIAGVVGDVKDAAVIMAVVLINSVLGFVQESRAENSLESLRQMLTPTCIARRGRVTVQIPAEDLVPGDVVLLDAGSQVPADGRLIAAEQLEVDESALTGESIPAPKLARISATFARQEVEIRSEGQRVGANSVTPNWSEQSPEPRLPTLRNPVDGRVGPRGTILPDRRGELIRGPNTGPHWPRWFSAERP